MSTDTTHVVAFGNQKGGVTKTSTVVNLAAALSERGKRVLIFDLDVNCGSTRLFGVPQGMNLYGTYELMLGELPASESIIRPDDDDMEMVNLPENVHLIAAHTKLEGLEAALSQNPFHDPMHVLKDPIQSLMGQYDYIFLDTSPSMTLPTRAAYVAAEYFVLTAVPERLAIEGLVNAIKYIEYAKKGGNPDLRLMGVVMNQVPGKATKLSSLLMDEVDKVFGQGDPLMSRYQTCISSSTIVPQMQQQHRTVFDGAPDHKVTGQFRELAVEFMARFDSLAGEAPRESEVHVNPELAVPSPGRTQEVVNG